uniref:Uncharacterized protein n=2 Tax=Anguilla anguilla TaxID=7936 RepID=A0A0E9RD31_ANGAN
MLDQDILMVQPLLRVRLFRRLIVLCDLSSDRSNPGRFLSMNLLLPSTKGPE